MPVDGAPDASLGDFLLESGLARDGESAVWTLLPGGASCVVWRVDLPGRGLCVKRALAKLRVAAEWLAPVERNASEWAWFEVLRDIAPNAVPLLLAHDTRRGVFAMEYLHPDRFLLWKQLLLDGHCDPEVAAAVGSLLGRIHAATANDTGIAARFATDTIFYALRIAPYLLATAERRPEVSQELHDIAAHTQQMRRALVHGDVSPKNILIGPRGPVFLDAECAWYGDPAFDVAFCLNHLVLKALVRTDMTADLSHAFAALCEAYFSGVDWEARDGLEQRVGRLLPALMLARVDGKSPVEYPGNAQQGTVRSFALDRLRSGSADLKDFYPSWRKHLGGWRRTAAIVPIHLKNLEKSAGRLSDYT
jgi:aminoglycoside phosphotransferase (APT) family kinase protein